jgi:chromosome segregation ATPase
MDELGLWLEKFTPSVCSSEQTGEKSFASLREMEELVGKLGAEKVNLEKKLFYLVSDNDYQTNEIAAMHEEIRRLGRENDRAREKILELGADCRRKDELNATLAGNNQEFRDKILWANLWLVSMEQAVIDYWMVERDTERIISHRKKPKAVSWETIKELVDPLRETLYRIRDQMMDGINLPK